MSAVDAKSGGGHGKAAGKALHSGRLAGMAFMQRAAQRKQLQERKEQAVRVSRHTRALLRPNGIQPIPHAALPHACLIIMLSTRACLESD